MESATQNPATRLEVFAQMVDFSKPYASLNGESIHAIEAFWRTLVANTGIQATTYPVPGEWVHHVAASALEAKRYLSESINPNSESDSNLKRTSTPEVNAILEALSNVLPVRDDSSGVITNASFSDWAMHHISFLRRFFITEFGYYGLSLSFVELGDEVVLFSGVGRRSLHQGRYQVLGDCHVHGIMDGELLHNNNLQWEDLCLF